MLVLELLASDLYAVLGRLLDHARVADLKLTAVSAEETAGQYAIRATIDTLDAERVDRLARKVRSVAGVAAVVIRQDQSSNQSRGTETLLVR
ncbi:MAG: hypothetical protein ACXWJ8_14920 [Xanthobacteraceae bacterium]